MSHFIKHAWVLFVLFLTLILASKQIIVQTKKCTMMVQYEPLFLCISGIRAKNKFQVHVLLCLQALREVTIYFLFHTFEVPAGNVAAPSTVGEWLQLHFYI